MTAIIPDTTVMVREDSTAWPRVHTCLHDWCPQQSEECKRCDALLAIVRSAKATGATR